MKCSRCHQDNPSQAKFCLECGTPADSVATSYADLKAELEHLGSSLTEAQEQLSEAQEQQAATAEILRVISNSPTDLQPVMEVVAQSAARLCRASDVSIFRLEGESLRFVAAHGSLPGVLSMGGTFVASPRSVGGRAVRDRQTIHIKDLATVEAEFPETVERQRAAGFPTRTMLVTPLLREGAAIGLIYMRRSGEVQPFTEKQIELAKTFAAQAVIAIENVRLFNETKEALEQQTATAEVLRVIASSPTDLQSALEAVAERAARLCESSDTIVFRVHGDELRPAALFGAIGAVSNAISPGFVTGRAVLERRTIHVEDLAAAVAADFPDAVEHQRRFGHRTTLATPLLREGVPIGAILIRRLEVRPFTEGQVRLLETFADQAVIAIENVRLFNELEAKNRDLTEALDQQTATSEILRVIASSPTDLQPVMDVVAKSAARFCGATNAAIFRLDGETLRFVAGHGDTPTNMPIGWSIKVSSGLVAGRVVLERRTIQVEDLLALPEAETLARQHGERTPSRTVLASPLLREGVAIGLIWMRRIEVRPFTEKQIALAKTFADQAVIAIENVRLFQELEARNRELTEALEQQTATAEILRVISSSPTDVQPVFDTIVRSAVRLCEAAQGTLFRFDGHLVHLVAHHGLTPEALEANLHVFPRPPGRGSVAARAILTRGVVHVDIAEDPEHEHRVFVEAGFRTVLSVPMLREGNPVGTITVTRGEDRPFTDTQIALLRTFADQAVIAIENVRLFRELEARNRELTESLEQQTATSEILRVIASSPTDLQPVMEAVAENAARVCGATDSAIFRLEGEYLRLMALHGPLRRSMAIGEAIRVSLGTVGGRVVHDRRTIHVEDIMLAEAEFPESVSRMRQRGSLARTMLGTPLLREGTPLGTIFINRGPEPNPFSAKQIALLETFANQAVIAIENVRLFTELQGKNRALTMAHAQVTEALDQQTATSEILRVISSSPTDIQPVFDNIARSAARLCEAEVGAVSQFDGEWIHIVAIHGVSAAGIEAIRRTFPMRPGDSGGAPRAIRDRAIVNIADVLVEPQYQIQDVALTAGYRSLLAVPLLREGHAIGVITLGRANVGEFNESQIQLLRTFADQAVIAIENVRLFTELEARNRELTESLEQQTATSEILRVIARSPTELQPVFDAIAERAMYLCAASSGAVTRFDGELVHLVALANVNPETAAKARSAFPRPPSRTTAVGRAILTSGPVQIPDVVEDPEYDIATQARDAFRSMLSVPMLHQGKVLGAVTVGHPDPGPFSERQTSLLQIFADQAVIAIENVRLFKELEARNRDLTEALEQQTATSEILRVISQSPTDVRPVFDIIAQRAVTLSDAEVGAVSRFDGVVLQLAALHGVTREGVDAVRAVFPTRLDAETLAARAFRARAVIHMEDVLADPCYQAKDAARAGGWRGALAVPMFRATEVIGVIFVGRSTARLFTDSQIELLKTFADQAVIAIENVRLFTELEARTEALTRSVDELTALGDVGRALSSTLKLETVLQTIVTRANELAGTDGCLIYEYDDTSEEFRLRASSYADPGEGKILDAIGRATPIPKGQGVASRAAALRRPVQVPDLAVDATYESPIRGPLVQAGYRAVLTVPLFLEERVIGVLSVSRKTPGEFVPEIVRLLTTFATQSALAIQNARLFREIEGKSRQLEAASRHKSEFLANMSHELRTPLNAILGFNEMILGQIYGEVPADLREPLTDIQHSGKHLLRLINNVLDLSKIEAGRMELALTDYAVQDIVERVRASLQSLAAEKGLAFVATVSPDVPLAYGDGGRITQCLLNLAGNALKFTHRGRVELGVELQGDLLVYRVADTGIGIAPDKIEGVFTEFRQGDATITSEFGGTGLGLSITKKFVEMHGGRIWVESEVGRGSTFFFAIPVRLTGGTPA